MTGKKKMNNKWIILGCVIAAMCALIAGIAVMLYDETQLPQGDGTISAGTAGKTEGQTDSEPVSLPGGMTAGVPTGTSPLQETSGGQETTPDQPTSAVRPTSPEKPTTAVRPTTSVQPQPTTATQPTTPQPKPTEPVIQQPVTLPQQQEATYEQWLSAGMLIGVSMSYPDFQLDGIYLAGKTPMADKMGSDGAYIFFTSGGRAMAIHSSPLTGERKTPGTTDLSTQAIGFATFDVMNPASVNTGALIPVEIGDLEELISQSLLVSLYSH